MAEPDMVTAVRSECGKQYELPRERMGQTGKCACGNEFLMEESVPDPAPEVVQTAPPPVAPPVTTPTKRAPRFVYKATSVSEVKTERVELGLVRALNELEEEGWDLVNVLPTYGNQWGVQAAIISRMPSSLVPVEDGADSYPRPAEAPATRR